MDNKQILIIVVIVLGLLIGFYLITAETRSMPFSVFIDNSVNVIVSSSVIPN